jgi:GT2 family glycosyltransferase
LTCPELVSVVIPSWNGRDLLPACVDSLLGQTYPALEIVVVDNGSDDGSDAFIEASYGDRVVLVRNPTNRGFAGGVNAGIRAARGEIIALLNNDAVADPRWIEQLLTGLAHGPDVGMCASKILSLREPAIIDKVGHVIYPDGLSVGRAMGERDRGQFDRVEETLLPDGCAALYSRRLLDDVGLFDEQFFAYCDDAELGLRARLYGWRCVYVPTAVAHHLHAGTFRQFSPFRVMLIERNRLWLVAKLYPWPLLAVVPFFTTLRYLWNTGAALLGVGSAGRFARTHSRAALLAILGRAYWSALRGLPAILRKRRRIRRERRLSDLAFCRLLWHYRISVRQLTLTVR